MLNGSGTILTESSPARSLPIPASSEPHGKTAMDEQQIAEKFQALKAVTQQLNAAAAHMMKVFDYGDETTQEHAGGSPRIRDCHS